MSGLPTPGNFSWVEPYLESPWVRLISGFAPEFPPPDAPETSEEWRRFASACAGGALALGLVGALAAIAVLLRSLCCLSRRPARKPSAKPVACMGVKTLLWILAGVASYLLVGHEGARLALSQVDRAVADVTDASRQGTELASFGAQLSTTLNATIPKCPQAVEGPLHDLQSLVEQYRAAVGKYNEDIKDIPAKMGEAKSAMQLLSTAGLYAMGAPLVLVMLCCALIVLVVCITRGTRGTGRCRHCCVRSLGALLFAPAILAVASLTAGEFGVGVAMGSFCRDADTNALTYIHQFQAEVIYDISRYYISGKGSNPLQDQILVADASVAQLNQLMVTCKPIISGACMDPEAVTNMTSVLASAAQPLDALNRLLSPHNVYPYYEVSVHQAACKSMISGLGWLVVFQFTAGVILLPALTCMADAFFGKWVAWNSHPMVRSLRRNPMAAHGVELSV